MGNFGSKLLNSVANSAGSLLGTGLGALAGYFQNKADQKFNAEQAQLNRDWQAEQNQIAYEQNLAQWNRENEYNSPEAQVQRLIDAGINPNAISGDVSGNLAGGSPQMQTGSGSQASAPGSYAGQLAQTLGNSVNTMWQNELLRKQVEGQGIDNSYKAQLNEVQVDKVKAETDKLIRDAEVSEEEKYRLRAATNQLLLMTPEQVNALNVSIEEAKQRIENMRSEKKVLDANADKIAAETELTEAKVGETNANTEVLSETKNKIHEEVGLAKQQNEINKAYLEYIKVTGAPIGLAEYEAIYYYDLKAGGNRFTTSFSNAVANYYKNRETKVNVPKLSFYQSTSDTDFSRMKKLAEYGRNIGWTERPSLFGAL